MEPIAHGGGGARARGAHRRAVAPAGCARPAEERGVHFHFFRYAPVPALNVFGYAAAMRADVAPARRRLARRRRWRWRRAGRGAARRARSRGATVMHGHWVVPGGVIGGAGRAGALPLVVSLHGSDVYVAETAAARARGGAGARSGAPDR